MSIGADGSEFLRVVLEYCGRREYKYRNCTNYQLTQRQAYFDKTSVTCDVFGPLGARKAGVYWSFNSNSNPGLGLKFADCILR